MTRVNFILILIALAGQAVSQQIEPSKIFDIIFRQDFEDDTPGVYNYDEYRQDWNYPEWSDPLAVNWYDYGQILIVDDGGNKVLRHVIRQGEASTDEDHGMQWWSPLGYSYNEIYFSFRLRLKPGFEPVLSGKFNGLKGGPNFRPDTHPGYDDGFAQMLTWNYFPDLVQYVYHQDQTTQSGQPYALGYGLPTGEWITVTTRMVMNSVSNDVGNNDGILETFVERNLVQQLSNLRFRNHENIGIEQLLITNFFGGDETPEWMAIRDEYVDYDDFFAFVYKSDVSVPHGYELSAPDRILLLPDEVYNDSIWRKSLTAEAVSSRTVSLTWKNYFYPVSYVIQRRTESDPLFQDISTVNFPDNDFRDADLLPNTTYYYRIVTEGSVTDPVSVTTQSPSLPSAPSSLVPLLTEKVLIKIGWVDNSVNEVGFIIERSDVTSDNFRQVAIVNPNVKEFTNSSLVPNTTYYFRVKAVNEDGQSDFSNVLSVTTLELQLPADPSELTAGNVTENSCLLSWKDNSNNELGFQIYRSLSETSDFQIIRTNGSNQNTYLSGNLEQGATYFYKVRAYNDDGVSEFSNTIQIRIPYPPESPADLILKDKSITSVSFEWTDNSGNEEGFYLERSLGTSVLFISIDTLEANTTEFTDNDLTSNTSYYFRLAAFNNDGVSDYSDTLYVHTPEDTVLLVPEDFRTDLVRYNKVTLSWSLNKNNIQGFEIERTTDTSEYILVARTGIVTSYSDTTVEEGVDYNYRIRSFNDGYYSSYSLAVSASVPYFVLPEPPELLSPVSIESNAIEIKWVDKSTDESGFIIKRALYPEADYKELYTTESDDTIFLDRTVTPNTTYYYMVNAVNENGRSKNSNQLRVSSLSLAEAARCKNGLIAYYNFSLNSDTIVHDLSRFSNPLDLLITDTLSINWTNNSRFEIINNTVIRSREPAAKIVNACKKTNEITLECWIKPTLTDYSSDATIISLSQDPENTGVSMMQTDYCFSEDRNYRYLFGLSTKSTESSGKPYLTTDENDIITLHHVAYTRNSQGEEKLFLNGEMVANSVKPLGFDNWKESYHLYLGNESTMEKPWIGMYYLMAIYDIALSTDQILQNYQAGPTDNISINDHAYDIKLFPNPSSGRIHFDIRPTESCDYGERIIFQLVDLNGCVHLQDVISDSNQPFQKEFDLSHLSKGIYYFRLISPAYTTTHKITLF